MLNAWLSGKWKGCDCLIGMYMLTIQTFEFRWFLVFTTKPARAFNLYG